MKYRTLADTGVRLSAVGLGCMGMSQAYGTRDDVESLSTLLAALELGINFWDTADYYGLGANEELLAKALSGRRDRVFIATKFGLYPGGTPGSIAVDASPAYMTQAVEASLRRLGTDVIDLYYAHRIDPKVPVEETVGAMAGLVREGKVRFLGLSEVSPDTLRRAHRVHPIAALQCEYSLLTRDPEKELLPLCRELHISFVPFSPLSRGLVTHTLTDNRFVGDDWRNRFPRFQGPHWENNRRLVEAFAEKAASKGVTPAQLALAWVLAQGEGILPIPGTKRRKYLAENAGAVDVVLSADDLSDLEALLRRFPDVGPRYPEDMAKLVGK